MWTREEIGCFDEKVGKMVGKAGGMLGKSVSPAFQFATQWYKRPYIDFFKQDTILSFPWQRTETISNGLLTFLTNEPLLELLDTPILETKAKEHLGIDSFGNKAEYDAIPNHFAPQYKKVPPLGS